jgi:hypothetical protein
VTSDGRFRFSLPPSAYRIVCHSPGYGGGRYPADGTIHVSSNKTISIDVACQER